MAATLPGVSFIIPVYNKAPYLPKVLAAVAAQAGDFPRQYVFVDDGSTDGSLAIVREVTAGWPNVIILTQENHGSAHATNRAIEQASEPYLKFVDADDLLAHCATEILLTALAPDEACLAFSGVYRYRDAREIDLSLAPEHAEVIRLASPLKAAMKNSLFNPTQMLARTECVRAVGGCDERVVHSQEYSLTMRLAKHWSFLKVNAPLAFLPRDVAKSLGADHGRQLRRVTLALGYFVRDNPDLDNDLLRFACRRAAGRAWKFARRYRNAGPLSAHFGRYLLSRLKLPRDPAAFIDACTGVFEGPTIAPPEQRANSGRGA